MERRELSARMILGFILFGLPIIVLGYQNWLRPNLSSTNVIDIEAAAPEAGGFSPGAIQVDVGEMVTLRFSAVDVTHGIAIGPGVNNDFGFIDPGEVREITLSFDEPGTYTFYCNVWCSPNHWRMRGVIEVRDPANPVAPPAARPDLVIVALQEEGVDIDAERTIYELAAGFHSSVDRGMMVIENLSIPSELQDAEWLREHTPAEALDRLRVENPGDDLFALLDTVAYLWTMRVPDQQQLTDAVVLYNKNCAACHGQTGGGDGPAAGLTVVEPVAFSNPAYMFLMRSDVLYAKIRRGGMGTDMPNFGTLFTPEETWALVDYLWRLAFAPGENESIP